MGATLFDYHIEPRCSRQAEWYKVPSHALPPDLQPAACSLQCRHPPFYARNLPFVVYGMLLAWLYSAGMWSMWVIDLPPISLAVPVFPAFPPLPPPPPSDPLPYSKCLWHALCSPRSSSFIIIRSWQQSEHTSIDPKQRSIQPTYSIRYSALGRLQSK